MKLSEILDCAEHWCQGAYRRYRGNVVSQLCLVAAIEAVTGEEGPGDARRVRHERLSSRDIARRRRYFRLTVDVLREQYGVAEYGERSRDIVTQFNDTPGRAFADVHAVAAEVDRRMAAW